VHCHFICGSRLAFTTLDEISATFVGLEERLAAAQGHRFGTHSDAGVLDAVATRPRRSTGTGQRTGLTMKRYFLLLLLLSSLLFADDQAKKVQRLEKVIWNPVTHVLSWEITEGYIDVHLQYEPERLAGTFFIEPQMATMSFAGKEEGFTHQEGDHLHGILDTLSHYLMSSTLWWQEGKGELHEARKADLPSGEVSNPSCTDKERRLAAQ
jgi:hypothetical protein